MKFFTKYHRPEQELEINSGTKLVETAGYIPAKNQIENLVNAGERLIAYRREHYDFPDGKIDETFDDPTRTPNFDLSDASLIQRETESKLKEQADQQKEKEKTEKDKKKKDYEEYLKNKEKEEKEEKPEKKVEK